MEFEKFDSKVRDYIYNYTCTKITSEDSQLPVVNFIYDDAHVSVKVYNIMGQLVDVIAEGSYSPNQYNWTWNAENLASGVYLVRTQVGSHVDTQKIMLLK